jgi:triacylglycerol lipase
MNNNMKVFLPALLGLLLVSACNLKTNKTDTRAELTPYKDGLTEDTACLLSQVAYCRDITGVLTQYMPGWKVIWEGKEANGNHAFVAGNGREFALAIRGSLIEFSWAAFQNWIYQDLHVTTQQDWPYAPDTLKARVSAGAYTGWQNLNSMPDINNGRLLPVTLDSLLDTGARLLITGHSLGGNLASIYGSYISETRKKSGKETTNINIITFAAPAAGNDGFARDFNLKFPGSIRVENRNDIVPKFPSPSGIAALGELYSDSLSAATIEVGYKNLQVPLTRVFSLLKTSFSVLEFTSDLSPYEQTNGKGKLISIPLSGKNSGKEVINWLNEAGYQHSIARYAEFEKVPVIPCK